MDPSSELSLKSLVRAVRLRWRLALGVASLVLAALAIYIFSLTPTYTSTAVVLLAPPSEALTDPDSGRTGSMTDPFFIRSETAILSGAELARTVIDRLELAKVPEFQPQPGLRERLGIASDETTSSSLSAQEVLLDHVAREYARRLEVFNDGRNKVVEISFASSDPRLAAKIANAHAEAYLQDQSKRRGETQQKAIEWLSNEVQARAAEVREADEQVQRYQLKHGIVSSNDATVVEQRLSQLNTQLGEARRQLSTQVALLSEIRNIRAGGEPGSASAMLTDDSLKSLLKSRMDAEASVALLEKRFAPSHPTLVKQRQELASINAMLTTQLRRGESEAESNASVWQRQVDDLTNAVKVETAHKVDQDRLSVVLPGLNAQAQVKRSVFEAVLNRYQTLLAERGFLEPAASIVSPAIPSARASFPNLPLFLVIAAMVSGLAGIVVAALLQLRRRRSVGLSAMADAVGIPPLVAIPRFRNAKRVRGALEMRDPQLFLESIRFLRDAVLSREPSAQAVTCLVTSILPRQGKSLVAMSLARAIARTSRRTLFIELDLRQPSASGLARMQPPAEGVASVLEGREAVADVVIRDESTGLHMLLAEHDASRALDRLSTPVMRDLLSRLQGRYDAIVIDSPPVGIVSDALALVPVVDQTLLVSKEGDSTAAELREGARLLQARGASITGLVLTSSDPDGMASVDKKTLHRYMRGVPTVLPAGTTRGRVAG